MVIEIKNIFTGEVVFSGEYENIDETVKDAISKKTNLSGANLSLANLSLANLRRANLSLANLRRADLSGANLSLANLRRADLSGADLSLATLSGADLSGANLSLANLSLANLRRADLSGADLRGAKYSLYNLLRSNWYQCSDTLTLELMRWDAIACGEEKITEWANGGPCPFADVERTFYFSESKKLWVPGAPTMNYKELFFALCYEKGIKL